MISDEASSAHRNDLIGRFVQHKVAANLLMALMLLAGILGIIRLNTQFLPTFSVDVVTVRVIWPGATAEDVARSVTTALEQELKDLDFVKEMRSTSSRGVSLVVIEYETNTDMGTALDQVKDRVALVRNLPSDAEEPQISKYTPYEDIATLILSSSESLDELRPLVYEYERQLLDAGIAKIERVGLPDQEVAIQVPSYNIQALAQSLPQLGERIVSQSQDIPAGTAARKEAERELRSLEKRRDEQGFRELAILTTPDGRRLTVDDIAKVEKRPKTDAIEVYYQGKPAVLLKLLRTENADSLESAKIFNDWLDSARLSTPSSIDLAAFNETYVLIEGRINVLLKNGLGGLVLVIAILFIFLNGRVAFWVAWGIPISFMGTLAILSLTGGSINMVSVFALIMALGIIVDDAIVVGEDALTHYTSGETALRAAEGGARRMFVPVLSSSLTTVAAFLPLLVVGGITGQILSAIPIVIICVIIASLIECFLILPNHLRHTLQKDHHSEPSETRQKLDAGFARFRDTVYRPAVTFALQYRLVTLFATLCALVLAISLVVSGRLGFVFFPSPDGTFVNASVKFGADTPQDTVQAYAFHMEDVLRKVSSELGQNDEQDPVDKTLVRLNTGSFDGGSNFQSGRQYATVQVELVSPDQRSVRNAELIAAWKDGLEEWNGLEQLSITSPRAGPPGDDIDVFLSQGSPDTLKQAATQLKNRLREFTGVSNIQDDLPFGQQQFVFRLKPAGEALGLTVASVGNQLRAGFDGQLLQVFNLGQEEIEVRIVLPDIERDAQSSLDSFPIVTPNRQVVSLSSIAHFESRRGLELLRHTDGRLGIHVTAEVDNTLTNANQILAELEARDLPQLAQTWGLQYALKGQAQEQSETQADMKIGAMVGIILMYLVLTWVFGSYSWPLAVMAAIPFGLTGAILGHWLIGLDLTMLSLFGFFGLSGIVVNDAIILVTFYQQLRRDGWARQDALIEAGCLRLRAVLLTSLTTIAGLLPLLFETSLQAQFLIPMAVSISFGLAFATLLVLIVIPVMLSLVEGLRERLNGAFGNNPPPPKELSQ